MQATMDQSLATNASSHAIIVQQHLKVHARHLNQLLIPVKTRQLISLTPIILERKRKGIVTGSRKASQIFVKPSFVEELSTKRWSKMNVVIRVTIVQQISLLLRHQTDQLWHQLRNFHLLPLRRNQAYPLWNPQENHQLCRIYAKIQKSLGLKLTVTAKWSGGDAIG